MIHLHLHDEYSLLDGVGEPEKFASYASKQGFKSMAQTNHGNIDGAISFQSACKNHGIRPIFGCEFYIVPDLKVKQKPEKRAHLLALVKNDTGWQNVLKMLTVANIDGFYSRPRIDPGLLLKHCEGLVISTACSSSFVIHQWGQELYSNLYDLIGDDLYLEIMPLALKEQIYVNRIVRKMKKRFGSKMIATNDCHYPTASDSKSQEVLLAVQTKKKWKDPNRWRFDATDLYLKTEKEMKRSFSEQGQFEDKSVRRALLNTEEVAEKCSGFTLLQKTVHLPSVPQVVESEISENSFLRRLCKKGFNRKIMSVKRKASKHEEYKARLEEELETITKQGFVKYFLIVWELVHWCKSNDILVGPGRGSCGGSLVVYLLDITAVDPIEFGLLFSRFISPARIDLPDIDIDFEDIRRPMIRKHLEDMYGAEKVAGISTFSTMKGKSALRDVSRVFDVPLPIVNKACAAIVTRSGGDERADFTIEDAFQTFEDGKIFQKKYPEVTRLAISLEGQKRGKGQHAAAIIVSDEDLRLGTRASLRYGKGDDVCVNWEKQDAEYMGLMKLDILGLNALTVLNEVKRLVKERKGIIIDFESLTLDDDKIFEEFSKGNNTGCFQVGSLGLKKFTKQLGIDDFGMLVHATSLYRPGTLRSGMTKEFIKRKRGEDKVPKVHPVIDELTKDTYGIILYQEQVMNFMYELGGLSWKTADTVRKVISKSQGQEQFQKFKKEFADGCVKKKTLDRKTATKLWESLASFGSYGFNKSHAVEYSMITYWDMWCKVYHPNEFICASLTYGSENKKEELIEEAIRLGLDVRPPKLGYSKSHDWVVIANVLYAPFIEIKGFGDKTAASAAVSLARDDRKAFYKPKGKDDGKSPKKISARYQNILDTIRSGIDEKTDDDFAENILDKYFKFSFVKDKGRRIKRIITRITKNLKLRDIKDINFNEHDTDYHLHSGLMTQIKFSYKSSVLSKKIDYSDGARGAGGVYGNFKDDTDFTMIIFTGGVYEKKKDKVEHCAGEYIIAQAKVQSKVGAIHCEDAWFQDDILCGNLKGLKPNLAEKRRFKNSKLLECKDCQLSSECRRPVMPSTGLYNIMIIGEAPGKDEDQAGVGFTGRAGQVVWSELEKHGYDRELFTVTNVVKCHPAKSKTPNQHQINKCASKWLTEEIDRIKPFLILAFGNTNLKFFTQEKSGIMAKNGTTEWNEKFEAYICWCIHPASVLYSPDNRGAFSVGMKNFTEKVKDIGGVMPSRRK